MWSWFIVSFVCMVLGSQLHTSTAYEECPSPWFRIGNQCFLGVTDLRSWASAQDYCQGQAKGGNLAQPNNIPALNDYLKYNDYASRWNYWLGGSDLKTEGDWRWLDGTSLKNDPGWGSGANPDDGLGTGSQDCLGMRPARGESYLDDDRCDVTRYSVCERPLNYEECPSPWFRIRNQCFLGVPDLRTWASAQEYCRGQAKGGDLAQPNNIPALNDYLKYNDYASRWNYWLGGSDLKTEDDWRWLDGTSLKNDPGWGPGANPDDGLGTGSQDCLGMRPARGESYLDDDRCDVTRYSVCERPLNYEECPSPWFRIGNQCFLGVPDLRTWASAQDYCQGQAKGGDLAQPNNIPALNDYLKYNDYARRWNYWLGGSDLKTEGDWRWLDGTFLKNDPGWGPGANPDDGLGTGSQDCLGMRPARGESYLDDDRCDVTQYSVCERPLNCSSFGGCPHPFDENNGNCYYFSSSDGFKSSWQEARNRCKNLLPRSNVIINLAELGASNSGQSDEWLLEKTAAYGENAWLGASKQGRTWIWDHSRRSLSLKSTVWGASEPSGDGMCVQAWKPTANSDRHFLNDNDCNRDFAYVCQIFK